ncbi:MAG: helix-turn-helix domain-containing protein [Rhizobiales bacterium]|nr:helix-turn-helix domain-containing protein [Hyphomicrobiales bacterium]
MRYLTIGEVSDLTGLSRQTLAKMRCAGTGPAFMKLGRAIRYASADLESWLASRRRTSTWQAANDNAPTTAAERAA